MKTSISIVAATLVAVTAMTTTLSAEDAKPKRSLKGNMTLKYNELPGEAKTFEEMFSKGIFYGRLRVNNFTWDYNDDTVGNDNGSTGIGGSFVYKSAVFGGFGVNLSTYYTRAVGAELADNIGDTKAGKDTFSRYKVSTTGDYSLMSLAEANIYYKAGKSELKVGQQIFESVFTKSNDTKMIPNSFMGAVFTNKSIEGTKISLAHFTAQKLRDHERNHDVITFRDDQNTSWANNDDSAIHRGLSNANFKAAGKDVDHTLSIGSIKSKLGKNLKTEVSYLALPDVLTNLTLEAHYTIKVGDTKIIPGFRYMMQKDDGGGAIGGASLRGGVSDDNTTSRAGYAAGAADSLDSSLLCARIDVKPGGMFKYRLGYSKVEDKADIVAPWRGFPTGGFTRAMAQYNWYANTETIMARIDGKINKTFSFLVRYAIQDFDDAKTGVQGDTNIIHSDLKFNLNSVTPGLAGKIRLGLVSDERSGTEGLAKNDTSYNEYRFELNYLF